MSQLEEINSLLDDMDKVRPVVIAAMPDDLELRATTRRMISALEQIRQSPGIPFETHTWISKLFAKLLDAEHGALLRPSPGGTLPDESKVSLEQHVEQRQSLLIHAQQAIPVTRQIIDRSSSLIGTRARKNDSLQKRALHLETLLRDHLRHDAELRSELQQLIDAFHPSLSAISKLLDKAGEESPELKQAKQLLEMELPDDISQAREILQTARKGILTAGTKLNSASEKLHETIKQNIEQLSNMSQQLEQAESEARNDPLTGLANRRRLAEFLGTLDQSMFCFLVVDIDHFKQINDTYGHDVGDEILQQLGGLLDECTRKTDLAARVGGEEFCIIFPETDLETSLRLAETLRQSIAIKPFKTTGGTIEMTVSIGLAEHAIGTEHSRTFKAADAALYQSKENGRNQVTCAS